jgi:hypothetical protein
MDHTKQTFVTSRVAEADLTSHIGAHWVSLMRDVGFPPADMQT